MIKPCDTCVKPCKQFMGELVACPAYAPEFPEHLTFLGVPYTLSRDQWLAACVIIRRSQDDDRTLFRLMKNFLVHEGLAFTDQE